MEVPRHWRLKKHRYNLGFEVVRGEHSGLPIRVTEGPRGMLEHLGLTPELIAGNRTAEVEAQEANLALPLMMVISESVNK